MFDFKRALRSTLKTDPTSELKELATLWGEALDPEAVLQEYPRPQMRRKSYANLNGFWECVIKKDSVHGVEGEVVHEGKILVPFSPEAPLSGVGHRLMPDETIWYRRSVSLFKRAGKRYLLHFEAVDHDCTCIVNGIVVGRHEGAYDPFCFDITDALAGHAGTESVATIDLSVKDPSEHGTQPRGKQRLDRGSIWYTAQSGIWQTVWIEEVPSCYISKLDVETGMDRLTVKAHIAGAAPDDASALSVDLFDEGDLVASSSTNQQDDGVLTVTIRLEDAHAWSPDDPHLYDIGISFQDDTVGSYCAFREFSIEAVEKESHGIPVFCCNHEPLFLRGVLDQGYWPDGLMTAPSDEALVFDIRTAQELGFNMLRKHLKTEPSRWYYHCDRLGMIVWQDIVNGGCDGAYPPLTTSKLPTLFQRASKHVDDTKRLERFSSEDPGMRESWKKQAARTIDNLKFFPCIATWTMFNEGWGQFDTRSNLEMLLEHDGTRPVDHASGWFDQGISSYVSEHNYFRSIKLPKGRSRHDDRARAITEFGGIAFTVEGHSATETAFGYGKSAAMERFDEDVRDILKEADALKREGLSAYVYTQLTDVEEELNGLVTYDRAAVKVRKS